MLSLILTIEMQSILLHSWCKKLKKNDAFHIMQWNWGLIRNLLFILTLHWMGIMYEHQQEFVNELESVWAKAQHLERIINDRILYEALPTLSFSFSASMNMSWYMDLFDEIIFIQFMNDSLDYVKMDVYYFWIWSIFTNSSHQYMHCYGLFESLSAYSSKEVKLT